MPLAHNAELGSGALPRLRLSRLPYYRRARGGKCWFCRRQTFIRPHHIHRLAANTSYLRLHRHRAQQLQRIAHARLLFAFRLPAWPASATHATPAAFLRARCMRHLTLIRARWRLSSRYALPVLSPSQQRLHDVGRFHTHVIFYRAFLGRRPSCGDSRVPATYFRADTAWAFPTTRCRNLKRQTA